MLNIQTNPSENLQLNSKATGFQQIQKKSLDIKIIKTLEKPFSPQKKSLPIKEFEYGQVYPKAKKRAFSQSKLKTSIQFNSLKENLKLDKIPIKIVKDKIQLDQNTKIQFLRSKSQKNVNIQQNDLRSTFQFNPEIQREQQDNQNGLWVSTSPCSHKKTARQLYEQREKSYQPKLSIFQRYNYENYENYNYKNPFKKNTFDSVIKKIQGKDKYEFPKYHKYQANKGSAKNLQIVFCQTKYPEFVKKTNAIYEKEKQSPIGSPIKQTSLLTQNFSQNIEEYYSDDRSLKLLKMNIIEELNLKTRDLFTTKNITKWTYNSNAINHVQETHSKQKKARNALLVNKKVNSKSTLEKLLQQFKALEKLSILNEKQQQHSIQRKKIAINIDQDVSKTCLVSLLVNKHPFLQSLSRSFRNHLLKTLFQFDVINDQVKISIHDYLKFNRIFISKDAPPSEVSKFTFNLVFRNSPKPSFQVGKNVLNQLNPKNKSKLQDVIIILFQLCNGIQLCYEIMVRKFVENIYWVYSIIDLIKDE